MSGIDLVGYRDLSIGGVTKYIIWWGVEICHLVGRRNMSFGRRSKYVICLRSILFRLLSKCVIWSGVETCHLVGRRNMSFDGLGRF